jgi:hypothetical protein
MDKWFTRTPALPSKDDSQIGVTIGLDVLKALVAMAVPDGHAGKIMLAAARNAITDAEV